MNILMLLKNKKSLITELYRDSYDIKTDNYGPIPTLPFSDPQVFIEGYPWLLMLS